uniref:Uncharacterized protein n=1 Tax=Mola mola TaxID=94237 RepID=A0A3Q4BEQ2_MOLML
AMFGEKVTVKEQKLSVHYLCLLTSCGVYQRGAEHEGVFGFLVDDIKQESRRSARLTCGYCKKKGACVGCNVRSCRKTVHFPCGRKQGFISQFTGLFPSYCPDHCPTQTLSVSSEPSLPQSCSICLDSIEPVLCYSILKCPSCHGSWFHRDCVQRQAHSAGLFFFRCTLCNSKENYQEEMLRMGIYIPERDASWEMEANAYSELLEVYRRCDAHDCLCSDGRAHSAKTGWFEVIRCRLCGSRGTHRKCSGLKVVTRHWACSDCTQATDGKGLMSSPRPPMFILDLRISSQTFNSLTDNLTSVSLSSFGDEKRTTFPSSILNSDNATQYFLKLLMQQIRDSVVFEGPDGCKNLALDSKALRDDLYFDVGCLLALSLVHGGPPIGFFSPALYQCLFNFPPNQPLTVTHMTPNTHFTYQMAKAESLDDLQKIMAANWEYLEVAGCGRPIKSEEEKDALVEELVNFTLITRMQLPLQRFREGLQTLGVFDQVQLFPSVFCSVFCKAAAPLMAQTVNRFFTINFSRQKDRLNREMPVISFWRHFLLECEVGRSSITLQDLLCFATGAEELPAAGFLPLPSISFLHPIVSSPDEGLFPQREPGSKHLILPVTSSYQAFKSSMEQVISHHMQDLSSQ